MTNNNELQITQRDATTKVLGRLEEMTGEGLGMPKNYNAANALNIAYLQLVDMKVKNQGNQPLLNVVTKKSVYESLLNMVLQGLSPAKNQVYFIPYGNELQMQRSYFGTQTALKRLSGVNDIWANVIYEADTFDMEIDEKGRERLVKHDTNFLNRDGAIVGAYAIIDTKDDGQLLTVMTKKEIDASWSQGKTTNVQNKFPQEMAKRTVINRAAKNYINTSDDADMLINAINSTTENEYDDEKRARDVTGTGNEEKAQDLLSEFKATNGKEKQEENEGFTQEQMDVLDDNSREKEEPKAYIADFTEIEEEWLPPKEAVAETANFSELTVPQIKERLDELGVKYDSNARKPELEGLLEMASSGGVQDGLF